MMLSSLKRLESFTGHPGLHKTSVFLKVPSATLATKAPAFYNREKEVEYLVSSLKKPPTLSLFTGPVNSGKSWVMD